VEERARMVLADELAYMTATELAARIRRRELSPVEVVDAFIGRMEARNQSLNALVYPCGRGRSGLRG
jgi:amidase